MVAREEADYKGIYFKDVAEYILNVAENFLKEAKKLLKSKS